MANQRAAAEMNSSGETESVGYTSSLAEKTRERPRATQAGSARTRKILVIGGAGYVGSVLVRVLLARGYEVRVLDDLLYDNGSAVADLLENASFSFIRGDFCNDPTIDSALDNVSDVILLAALVGDPICRKYPDRAKRINQDASIRLFDMLANRPVERFVFASTCSNYGLRDDGDCATEESELNPQSLYAETKVNVERYILENKRHVPFSPTILRVATAYGLSPRMRFDLTVSEFVRDLVVNRELVVYDENTWRPYCHVRDISEAIAAVLESPREKISGEVFNVGGRGENYTKKMIVDIILGLVKEGNVHYREAGSDQRNYRVSFDKISSVLSFKNRWKIEHAAAALVSALRNGLFDDFDSRKRFYGNYYIEESPPPDR